MKSIREDIKNLKFKKTYLFYGEEGYLKQQYKDMLLRALIPEEDTMNTTFFEGKAVNPKEVIDLAETMPFFAEHRVIILQNTGFFKNKCDDLADYLKDDLPDYLCMIFVEEEVDKRNRMYKAVKAQGRVTEFSQQDTRTLTQWMLRRIGGEGKKITQRDMELLLTMTGNDMSSISTELEKLLSYTLNKDTITAQDIQAVCTPRMENKIFDMVRAVTDRKQERALQLYNDLLALKEPPMRILFLLARQFNQLLQVKELQASGFGSSDMASKLKIPPFAVKTTLACAQKYSGAQLRQAVQDCMDSEEAVKTGRLGDVLSVELLIIKYSSAQKNSP